MNQARLPQWARFNSTGSPRRVAQFEEHRDQQRSTRDCSPFVTSPSDPFSMGNPFVSSSSSLEYTRRQKFVQDFLEDNLLIMYCRQGLWEQALERCDSHPDEARPALQNSDFFEESWASFLSSSSANQQTDAASPPLYEPTPLGILCDSSHLQEAHPETLVVLATALCQVGGPIAVSVSQQTVGHTPLRQAMRNPRCPPSVVGTLLRRSDHDDALRALRQPDEHGVYPLDHLLQRIRRQQVSHADRVQLLQAFVTNAPLDGFCEGLDYSPLVRFYATVSTESAGLQPSWWRHQISVPSFGTHTATSSSCSSGTTADDVLVLVTRTLVEAMPSLLTKPSLTTGCMPVHAALRNHGDNATLMEILLAPRDHPDQLRFMLHRNNFGDLPVHAACACGVPLPVLRLVLGRTVRAAARHHGTPAAVVWSTNHAGYTPVDLEWIRHIEAGHGFLSQAVFQAIGVEGIPRPRGRYDDLYVNLLRQAVNQVIASNTARSRTMETTPRDIFGLLLHRIFLITRATFHDSFSQSPFDLTGDILHQAAALFQPRGPSMPEAIMDLLLWQFPEQVPQRDHSGRTPLHHAVQVWPPPDDGVIAHVSSERQGVAWERWVHKLLSAHRSARDATRVADHRGRYPLHAALDGRCREAAVQCREFHNVVVRVAKGSPDVLQIRDPVSRLFPATQAACHPLVPLDTVYWLLRRAPGVLS